MTPKEAIEELWKSNFFESVRSLSDIEKEIFSGWKINPSNLLMTLKLKSVKKILMKKPGGWTQRAPFTKKEGEITIHYFEPGKPRTSRKNFVSLLNELKGGIKICDPYMNKDTLDALEELKNATVKFLTSYKPSNLSVPAQDLKDFKAENKNVEIKGFPHDHLHDRYIISKDRLFLLGHGFSIRNKESFIIELPKKFAEDLIQSLSTTFDIRWKNKDNVILC